MFFRKFALIGAALALSSCTFVTTNNPSLHLSQVIAAKVDMHIISPGMEVKRIDGESHAVYLPKLVEFIASHGLTVKTMTFASSTAMFEEPLWGYYDKPNKVVWINTELPINAQVATLVHEFGHHLQPISIYDAKGQVFAEAVSYYVCLGIGLDTEESSEGYMSNYEYSVVLTQYATQIDVATQYILKGIR